LHGITYEKTNNSQTFNEAWPEIHKYLMDAVLVAHNAYFDSDVIAKSLRIHGVECDNFSWLCTAHLSRLVLPDFASHRLDLLCDYFEIDLLHHNALSDAMACANLLLLLVRECGCAKISTLLGRHAIKPIHILFGERFQGITSGPKKNNARATLKMSEINKIDTIHEDSDFSGKKFVFTGELRFLNRDQAHMLVKLGGGTPVTSVSRYTDFLVMGMQDMSKLKPGTKLSSKAQKAYDLHKSGIPIQIIGEDEFMEMVDDELMEKCEGLFQSNIAASFSQNGP
jgi:DNA polymerase-3 subunit epsilon